MNISPLPSQQQALSLLKHEVLTASYSSCQRKGPHILDLDMEHRSLTQKGPGGGGLYNLGRGKKLKNQAPLTTLATTGLINFLTS